MLTRGLIIGRGAGVLEQASAAADMAYFSTVVAINVAGCDFPHRVDHWVSYHPGAFALWRSKRRAHGLEVRDIQFWTAEHKHVKMKGLVDPVVEAIPCPHGGSSGLLATWLGLTVLGLDKIVLCGIPLENTPRYDDPTNWHEAMSYRPAWVDNKEELASKVRSMSGWTKNLLGAPTRAWLHDA